MTEPQSDLIGPAEAAALLNVGVVRLAQLVRERHLEAALVLPRCRVFSRATVLEFASRRAEQAKADPRMNAPAIAP